MSFAEHADNIVILAGVDYSGIPGSLLSRVIAGVELPPANDEDTMTAQQWWDEFKANACCPDAVTAARRFCGCGGSAQVPTGISRLLLNDENNHE
jgi:hypothetical protein